MRASLPNARFIAFTGTPIAKHDKDTLREFGAGDYIDTYRLDEAVADSATLPIKYQEGMTELTTDAQLDNAFTDTFGQEDEGRQAKLKQALLKRRRTASDRIEANTRHLLDHFLSSVKARGSRGCWCATVGRWQCVIKTPSTGLWRNGLPMARRPSRAGW
nr:hypothetical protein [Endozoicomonas sp. ONNA2]